MNPESDISLNKKEWDYSQQAIHYASRPNYAGPAIDELARHVGARKEDYQIADVGAGTANLTLMLLERGFTCVAVEPNAAMRKIGMERTRGRKVRWVVGTGEQTGLEPSSVDWFVMGSSFNTTERMSTLREANRVLKSRGFFSCLWNHRDLENDPIQKRVEGIIRRRVPPYSHGTRREDPTAVILASELFKDIHYIEGNQKVERSLDQYIDAWESVKNPYWDLETEEGRRLFGQIAQDIRRELAPSGALTGALSLTYTTRIWTARKIS